MTGDHKLTVTLVLDEEGKALLATLQELKAGGRLVTPDLVSHLVKDRDEWKGKHDNLKGLLESYKKQWESHYAREYDVKLRELRQQFETARDDLADDRVTATLEAVKEKVVECRFNDETTELLTFIDNLSKQGGVPLKGKYP